MFWNKKKENETTAIDWSELNNIEQLEELKKASESKAVAIFKHSTRCNISSTALNRLERAWQEGLNDRVKMYFLDLIAHRNISNAIADEFGVEHQSPQLILLKNGKSVYQASHLSISVADIKDKLENNSK